MNVIKGKLLFKRIGKKTPIYKKKIFDYFYETQSKRFSVMHTTVLQRGRQ